MGQTASTKSSTPLTKDERLFFAADISAAWPKSLPKGRLIKPELRHITLAFFGKADRNSLMENIPLPEWRFPPAGFFDQWIFLPSNTPRVVAALPHFIEGEQSFLNYQKKLSEKVKERDHFMAHASISRDPFDQEAWAQFPCKIPFFIQAITLYKSLGHSNYEKLWEKKMLAPFEEIEHTADIAYRIRGENFTQLALHALLALSFSYPAFMSYLDKIPSLNSVIEIIELLNEWISEIDISEGINLKAVSYHATITGKEILEWTMIVDV